MAISSHQLTRRERQMVDILYRLGEATAAEIQKELPDPPSYSSVRKLLSILEDKGLARHIERDRRYIYLPSKSKHRARQKALKHLVHTFFDNSAKGCLLTMIDMSVADMSDEELLRLAEFIEVKRSERKK